MKCPKHNLFVNGKERACYRTKSGESYFKMDNTWHIVRQMQPQLKYDRIDGRKVPQAVRVSSTF